MRELENEWLKIDIKYVERGKMNLGHGLSFFHPLMLRNAMHLILILISYAPLLELEKDNDEKL